MLWVLFLWPMAAAYRLNPINRLVMNSALQDRSVLYNSLIKTKEKIIPLQPNLITFYSCGPTVYDFAHIGNFRAFLTYDILKRWLLYCGYNVNHVCNLTDVDDKILIKMKSENKTLKEITNKYADAFFEDLAVLNIIPANRYPRATEHIHDIEEMISTLVEKGFAYIEAGSVYFRVSAFSSYGQMVNLDASDIKEGAGGSGPNERRGRQDKENERDFVLWKAFAEGDGEVVWDSKFGRGRPGWHIECSAMINSILGKTIDIHAGGVDLMFPHHTNEIAQSEAYSGQKMCNCWIHNGFVNINNEKMSKSLKNFKTLRDIASTAFDARAFRFMIVSAQYRAALNYAPDTFSSAVSSLKRIDKMVAALKVSASVTGGNGAVESIYTETSLQEYLDAFELAMCDDLNTARAMAAVFGLVNAAEKGINVGKGLAPDEAKNILSVFLKMDSVLGLIYDVPKAYFTTADVAVEAIPEEMYNLARKRSSFKASKMYAEADAVRQELANAGYVVKDLKGGEFELLRI